MSKFRAVIFFVALEVVCQTPALAERADRNKPLVYEADAARHDDLRQVSTLTGNVLISKGTINIRAARVEIRKDNEGYQHAVASADAGKRVFFRQKREGVDEFIEAEAEQMDYNEKADTVSFARKAVIRRYRGATLADEASGHSILYDNKTESFSVDQMPAVSAAGVAQAPVGGRVRGMLTPRPSSPAADTAPLSLRPASATVPSR